MTKRMLTATLAIAATLALALTGCGSTNTTSSGSDSGTKSVDQLTIGFLQRQLDAPYYAATQAAAEDLAAEQGFTLLYQDAGNDAVTQLDQAQTMIAQGADAIIVNVVSAETERDQLAQIAEEIPLIFVDSAVEGVGVTAVSSDNVAIGEMSGELAAKRFEGKDTIKVAVVQGDPGDVTVGPAREKGFLAGLEKAGLKVDVVSEVRGNWAQDVAQSAAETVVAGNPDLDLIFGLNDSMTLGALTALEDAGNTTTLVAAAADGQKEALAIIYQGCDARYISTGLNSPKASTERAIEIAIDVATGEASADDYKAQEFTDAAGIDCNNVADYYDPNSVF